MTASIRECEREVERARTKLAGNLAALRSPATFSAFADDIQQEARGTKDMLIGKVQSSVRSSATDLLEDLKSKAAANPAAALAIAAGIAWRLIRHPPIATGLVGLGLYGLLKTPSSPRPGWDDRDYFSAGAERLKEQVTDAAVTARDAAVEVGELATAKAAEVASAATEQAQEWGTAARESAQGTSTELMNSARNFGEDTTRSLRRSLQRTAPSIVPTESRDTILLGAAALSVAGALGIALQRHIADSGTK